MSGTAACHSASDAPVTVVLFRNDLRVADNAVLHAAASTTESQPQSLVVPLYCFDPASFRRTAWGSSKTGAFRSAFLLQSVAALQASLQSLGSDLLTCGSSPATAVTELLEAVPGRQIQVLTQREVTSEEVAADAAVQDVLTASGRGSLQHIWGSTLLHLGDLPYDSSLSDFPDVFTHFRNKVEEGGQPWPVRHLLPALEPGQLPLPPDGLPRLPSTFRPQHLQELSTWAGLPLQLPPPCLQAVMQFEGGQAAAQARLHHYIWDSGSAATYADTRNGMLHADDSTKLSPWLALGCSSPRQVYWEVKKYEEAHGANKSTYMLAFHLLVRDYFRFQALKHGDRIFHKSGVTGGRRRWRADAEAFERWRAGQTGIPFVDAHMRELLQTGWMSNRGRQNVASYLTLDLQLDWRRGADWFESQLVDYDVASNWVNWAKAAGVLPGRTSRFNVRKQASDYDADGEYVSRWVPELAGLPPPHIHEPWRMTEEQRDEFGVRLPRDYPLPIPGTRYDSTERSGETER